MAALVAKGVTNREIAARLFISECTAEGDVEQSRNKLGFPSHIQIAAWSPPTRARSSQRWRGAWAGLSLSDAQGSTV